MLLIASILVTLGLGQPEAAGAGAQTSDPWAQRPTLMATDYPQAALDAGLSGEATIRCRVAQDGAPADCEVLAEEPAGYGFGAAAVAVVQRGRITSAAVTDMGSDPSFTVRIPFLLETEPEAVTLENADAVVTLRCRLGQTLLAESCVVVEETPEGEGYGQAAIRIVEGRAMAAEAVEGHQAGASFTIRIPFRRAQD